MSTIPISESLPSRTGFFVTGGTMRPGALSYVERNADRELLQALKRSEFCYVLDTRQMGKSSLMARAANELRRERKYAVVSIDLTNIGSNLPVEKWYDEQVAAIGRQLRLEDEIEDFLDGQENLGPLGRWSQAIQWVVLEKLSQPLVIFVDEIDFVRLLPFPTDDFFAGIRYFYNARALDPRLERVTFCLLGASPPNDLIRSEDATPFNLGRRIVIKDFELRDAQEVLAPGLHPDLNLAGKLLERVFYWTDGHPFLTQCLCEAVSHEQARRGNADVDRVCGRLFLAPGAREQDINLKFTASRLLLPGHEAELLNFYGKVRRNETVLDDGKEPFAEYLKLSGIAKAVDGKFRVRNEIYRQVFDERWIADNTPEQELRRQEEAARRARQRTLLYAALALVVLAAIVVAAFLFYRNRQLVGFTNDLRAANRRASAEAERAKSEAKRATDASHQEALARDSAEKSEAAAVREANRANRERDRANQETFRANQERDRANSETVAVTAARAAAVKSAQEAQANAENAIKAKEEAEGAQKELQHTVNQLNQANDKLNQANAELGRANAVLNTSQSLADVRAIALTQPDLNALLTIEYSGKDLNSTTYERLREIAGILPAVESPRQLMTSGGSGRPGIHALSANGKYLAVEFQSQVCVLDLSAMASPRCVPAPFSPQQLAVTDSGDVRLAADKLQSEGTVMSLSLNQGLVPVADTTTGYKVLGSRGCKISTATGNDTVTVVDVCAAKKFPLKLPKARLHIPVEFSADESLLLTIYSNDGAALTLMTWQLDTQKPTIPKPISENCFPLTRSKVSSDLKFLYCGELPEKLVSLTQGTDVAFPDRSSEFFISADNKTVVRAVQSGVQIWQSSRLLRTLPISEGVTGLQVSPDGFLIGVGIRAGSPVVRVFDVSGTEQSRLTVPPGSEFFFVGRMLALISPNHDLRFLSPKTPNRSLVTGPLSIGSFLGVTPDGANLVTGLSRSQNRVRVYDLDATPNSVFRENTQPFGGQIEAFSGDGLTVVAGTTTQGHVAMSANTNRIRRMVPGNGQLLAVSRNGQSIAVTSSNCGDLPNQPPRCIAVTDVNSGAKRALPVPSPVFAHFSPDGSTLQTVNSVGIGQTWEIGTGRERGAVRLGSTTTIPRLISGSRSNIIVAAGVGEIVIWNTNTNAVTRSPLQLSFNAALSDDGRYLATADNTTTVTVYTLPAGDAVAGPVTITGATNKALVFDHSSKHVLAAGGGSATLIPIDGSKPLTQTLPQNGNVLGFTRDDSRLAVSAGGAAHWFDASTLMEKGEPLMLPAQAGPRLSPDGRWLALSWSSQTTAGTPVKIVSLVSGSSLVLPGNFPTAAPTAIAVTSGVPLRVAVATTDGTVLLASPSEDASKLAAMDHGAAATALAFSPDSSLIAAAGGGWISLFNVGTAVRSVQQPFPELLGGLTFVEGGSIVAATESGLLRILAPPNLDDSRMPLRQEAPVTQMVSSPSSDKVIAVSPDFFKVWNTKDWSSLSLPEKTSLVRFSPTGRYFAARTSPRVVDVWTTNMSAKPVAHIQVENNVVSFAFSPDDRVLGIASAGSIDVWRFAQASDPNQELIASIPSQPLIADIAFRPGNLELIVGTRQGNSFIASWRRADLIKDVCGSILRKTSLSDAELESYHLKGSYHDFCAHPDEVAKE